MAYRGQTISNPATGETLTFLQTARDTGGELLVFDVTTGPGTQVAAVHVHPRQEERIEMIRGRLAYRLGSHQGELGQGERVDIPAGVPHWWGNPTEEEIIFRVEFRPALEMEGFFELFFGLGREGKCTKKGVPTFWQLVLVSRHYEVFASRPPIWMQRSLFGLLAPVALLLGYRPTYDRFIGTCSDSAAQTRGF